MALFRQQIRVFVDRELSSAARAAHLAAAAKQGVADLIASGRASPRFQRFVDGREGAPEESVDGEHGRILYQFSFLADAVVFAIAFLRGRSPVESGRYRDSFVVAVDGRPIRAAQFDPAAVPPTAEVVIYNPEPYSRKVDVQMVGAKRLRFNVPPALFDDAAKAVRSRFGNSVTAKRVYTMLVPGQYRLVREQRRTDRPHFIARPVGTPVENPALIINPLR